MALSDFMIKWADEFYSLPYILAIVAGLSLILSLFVDLKKKNEKSSPETTLDLIKNRRSISPKSCLSAQDNPVDKKDIKTLLEAANWAPTHGKTEPWRYVIISGQDGILKYLNFIEKWYTDHSHELSEELMIKFRNKFDGLIKLWPENVSHLIMIVMKRQSLSEKLMPEWEELCAVSMSVQNIHLMATSMDIGIFWSSHTWCKDARDSHEFKKHFGFLDEDKILGVLTVGKYDKNTKFTSTRRSIDDKVQFIE